MKVKTLQKLSLASSAALSALPLASGLALAADLLPDASTAESSGYFGSFNGLVSRVLTIVMIIGALLVLFYLIWGGIDWITSGGDKSKTESARNKITAAVIGLIILAASYAVFQLVIGFLGVNVNDLFNSISP